MHSTKIRTWTSRHNVQSVLMETDGLNLATLQLMDSRLSYALTRYPWVQMQVIVYGEDKSVLNAAELGSKVAQLIAEEAQARWSSFANVVWCIANDVRMYDAVRMLAIGMAVREPWGTLISSYVQVTVRFAVTQ